jgi:hypothetical protein
MYASRRPKGVFRPRLEVQGGSTSRASEAAQAPAHHYSECIGAPRNRAAASGRKDGSSSAVLFVGGGVHMSRPPDRDARGWCHGQSAGLFGGL